MSNFITYIRESFQEVVYNVTWPEYKQLQKDTVSVIIASLAFALVIALIDYLFDSGLDFLYQL
ncbi:MAG: preprotein translocase subunit SecE [Cytophagales bacterium]|nr:preprotein translocase subunit SecE [Cytophagales bacterium]